MDESTVANAHSTINNTLSGTVAKVAGQELGTIAAKASLANNTVISLAVNLTADPENPGKVIASTVLANGVSYAVSEVAGEALTQVIAEILVEGLAVSAGEGIVIAGSIVLAAVAVTQGTNEAQTLFYNIMDSSDKYTLENLVNDNFNTMASAYAEKFNPKIEYRVPPNRIQEACLDVAFDHPEWEIDVGSCIEETTTDQYNQATKSDSYSDLVGKITEVYAPVPEVSDEEIERYTNQER